MKTSDNQPAVEKKKADKTKNVFKKCRKTDKTGKSRT